MTCITNKDNCKSSSSPQVCFGDYIMKRGSDYLYHGSNKLFRSPYLVDSGDNRLSPDLLFPSLYATKGGGTYSDKIGFIYKYKPIENIVVIPNILFACGKFNQVKNLLDQKLGEYKMYERQRERKNISAYDETMSRICSSDKNGIFIPSLENQILLCGDISKYLTLDEIYIVIKKGKYNYINFNISTNSISKQNLSEAEYDSIMRFIEDALREHQRDIEEEKRERERKSLDIFDLEKEFDIFEDALRERDIEEKHERERKSSDIDWEKEFEEYKEQRQERKKKMGLNYSGKRKSSRKNKRKSSRKNKRKSSRKSKRKSSRKSKRKSYIRKQTGVHSTQNKRLF
jgi:hypothetical protein